MVSGIQSLMYRLYDLGMTKKSRNKGMEFLNAGLYLRTKPTCIYICQYVAKNPVGII